MSEANILDRFSFKTVVAGILTLISDASKLTTYGKHLKDRHKWFFHNDVSEERASLRQVIEILYKKHKANPLAKMSLLSFDSVITGVESDPDKYQPILNHYRSWISDPEIQAKIKDSQNFVQFVDYLKTVLIAEASRGFGEKYKTGMVDDAIKVFREAFMEADKLSSGNCSFLKEGDLSSIVLKSENNEDNERCLLLDLDPFDSYSGGFDTETLNVFVGRTNAGKSMMATHLMKCCVNQGIYAWVGILEDRKKSIAYRIISSITQIPISRLKRPYDLLDWEKEKIIECEKRFNKYVRLEFIYGKDVNTVNKMALDYDIECEIKNKPKPSVNIVDYTGHIAAKSDGSEMHNKFRNAFAARKDFCLEHKKIGFDFAQINRQGAVKNTGNDIVTHEDLASSYDLAQVCDNIISLNRGPEDIANDRATLFFSKARDGLTSIGITVKTDFAKSTFDMSVWNWHPNYRPSPSNIELFSQKPSSK